MGSRHAKRGVRCLERRKVRLIKETEAFLSGNYVDYVRRRGATIPGWAWLNRSAHGDVRSIRAARRSFGATSAAFVNWPEEAWKCAQRILANELLEFVDNNPEMLTHVQRDVLIPLELELIQTEETSGLTASQLVRSTRAALRSSIS